MSQKSAFVRARIAPDLKVSAEAILDDLGITPTQAVTMLYKKIAREHQWPLELKIPNVQTRRVLLETDEGIGLLEAKDTDDLFKKLGVSVAHHPVQKHLQKRRKTRGKKKA